ncbi:MAG: sulfite exporter TauE/SafE family protein [Candidatus Dojkabacteria bacterium]|uniref:Sulfite exporter TauE/SafE family protein n=2 Tax=Candidatus Dojkabacteria TaxID=74243 RepID=A0A952AK76_9BACT|nr:sulfite exporter TauE/SafE family protein [Candidatus Dojkabacteria bacterium]WKZ27851.1 MAG: sulfite exporter TauE/SafE family protein [Candidatus Dojkabacteria bacterium]
MSKLKECVLYVDGMHCAACEVLIEKKLLEQSGVESVDASLKGAKVTVHYSGDKKPSLQRLNKEFAGSGYVFSEQKSFSKRQSLISIKNGKLVLDKASFYGFSRAILLAAIILAAFFIFESLHIGQFVSIDASSSLPAFFVLGLVAGISSCAALIGGLLLSMTKQWHEIYAQADARTERSKPHIMFHLGRIVSFALLGGLLGLAGETISLSNTVVFSLLTILVSLVMLILALQMIGVEWAHKFRLTTPKFLSRFVADETNFQGRYMPAVIGALTFILPCGFTLTAQTIALASGSFLQGSLIMLFFALGTFIPLMGISLGGLIFNSKKSLSHKFNLVAGILVLFFVVYNINGQLNVLGLPSLSDLMTTSQQDQGVAGNDEDGVQIISITAQGFEYTPTSSLTIKAGLPAKLIVDNQGIQGCGAFIAANGLIDDFVALKKGINEIDLGLPAKGSYKLTCSMGMVKPLTINVI